MPSVINDVRGSRAFIRSFNALGVFKPLAQKYFTFVFSEVVLMYRIPPRRRGAYASSRYVEAGCDGRASCGRRPTQARTAKSCGPGVPVLTPSAMRGTSIVATRGQES